MNPVSRFTPRKPRREKTTLSNSDSSLKEPVQVYCRLRPLKEDLESTCIKLISPTILSLTTPSESKGTRKEVHYKFKHIFTAYSSQKEVFVHIAYPLLDDLLKGKNGLLFTYGVTGSGKTYTLTGEHNNPGIIPRCIDTVFNSIGEYQAPKFVIKPDKMNGFEVQSDGDAMQDRLAEVRNVSKTPKKRTASERTSYVNDGTKISLINESCLYCVFVSYIEVYNNTVFDLLDESTGKSFQGKILREDAQKNMYVNGVVEVEVKSAADAFEVFHSGQRRKRMGHTILNAESSRSHAIFNIRVVQLEQVAINNDGQPMVPDCNLLKVSQLSLVDLAGSERTNRTQNTGARLREASSINNSLMALRNCLDILRENQLLKSNRLVPYRDSRLTLLFKNYFEGDGSVQMIVCVNPSVEDFEENLQVMKFAEITQDIKVTKSEAKYTPYKKTTERIIPTPKVKSATSSFTMLPEIPVVKFDSKNIEEWGSALEKIEKILRIRKKRSKTLDEEIDNKTKEFRRRLVEINQENCINKTELRSLKTIIKKEKQKVHNYETKTVSLETVNENLNLKNEELQQVIYTLQNIIKEKDLKINQNVLEKEKTKQKLALASEKMSQELDAKLKKQREHLNAAMRAKENKLKQVRQILDSDTRMNEFYEPEQPIQEVQTEPQQVPANTPTESPHRRNLVHSSTPRARRSRSAGEVWLEHNTVKPVPLGTVLQPCMKKRKSVTKLTKASDITNPKQSKYCLVTQQQDMDGELETKVVKGDIFSTCGGGAQVIFNDVEKLRQESPTASPN